jgi:hypothetical protein
VADDDSILTDLTPPAKRNVKALTAALADLQPGDAVAATFATERYGVFVVRGEVTASTILGSFALGSHPLDANKKPAQTLRLLRTFHSAEREAAEASETAATADSRSAALAHGDLVRATVSEPAYGVFDIAGVAVHSAVDDSVLVGSWIISTKGVLAERVRAVEVLEAAGSHEIAVPKEITTWGTEALAEI